MRPSTTIVVASAAALQLLSLFPFNYAAEIDNALVGTPQIDCNSDTIEMKFKTRKRFTGKIYVQGHYSNPDCRVDYSQTNAVGDPIGGIRLHHGSCDMDRQRMVQPEGMQFSTVLVISFHPLFVTKTDRAFHINCMYREQVKAVTAGLTVSPIAPDEVQRDMPMPSCSYTIRKDELDGPILRYAKVGDQVVHRWECPSDMYGMLVHSCNVEDGQGEKQLVIDERGCHTDRVALGDPTYSEALTMAYRESSVFKFADKVGVRFACEIKLCIKEADGCAGITPPLCNNDFQNDVEEAVGLAGDWTVDANSTNTSLNETAQNSYRVRRRRAHGASTSTGTVSTDVISPYIYVIDAVENGSAEEAGKMEEVQRLAARQSTGSGADGGGRAPSVCLSSSMFAMTLFIVAVAFAFVAIVVLHILFRNRSKHLLTYDSNSRRIINSSLALS